MKLYHLGWNQTHLGHYLKPDRFKSQLTADQLRHWLRSLIHDGPRTCRIWVNGNCVWYYNDPSCFSEPTTKIIDNIMKDLS